MTTALYELLVRLHMQEQIERQREQFEADGLLAQAKENEQIYGIVMELFDKMVELLGDEPVSRREFAEILDAGFEASKVGIIPPGFDRVLFGDIERTRLEHIRGLFFIGVNDGIIPKKNQTAASFRNLNGKNWPDLIWHWRRPHGKRRLFRNFICI